MSSKITRPSPLARFLQLIGLPLVLGLTVVAVVPIWSWNWIAGAIAIFPVLLVVARLVMLVLGFFMRFTPEGKIRDSLKAALAAGDLEEVKRLRDRMVDEFGMVTEAPSERAADDGGGGGAGGEAVGDLGQFMLDSAEMHVSMAAQNFEMELDYSEASLAKIDDAITKFHPDGAVMETTYIPYTAYVGEVVRRNVGGDWEQTEDRGPAVVSSEPSFTVFPYAWVVKRFENGMEDSIAFKFGALKKVAEGEA